MDPIEPEDLNKGKTAMAAYSKYSSIVLQMVAIIGIFAFAGYKIDAWQHHDVQWVTAIFCVAGVCLSIYQTIRQLKE